MTIKELLKAGVGAIAMLFLLTFMGLGLRGCFRARDLMIKWENDCRSTGGEVISAREQNMCVKNGLITSHRVY
jgi:hypothetical protein